MLDLITLAGRLHARRQDELLEDGFHLRRVGGGMNNALYRVERLARAPGEPSGAAPQPVVIKLFGPDERLRARAYTREHGEDVPEISGWSWPYEPDGTRRDDVVAGAGGDTGDDNVAGGSLQGAGDRMRAVLDGLAAKGVEIDGAESVAKSFPGYWDLFDSFSR